MSIYSLPLIFYFLLVPYQSFSSTEENKTKEGDIPFLEKAQDLFGTKLNRAADELDSFFATDRADDEFGRSRIRVRSSYTLRDGEKSDLKNQYRINIRLPGLEERLKLHFSDEQKETETTNGEKKVSKKKDVNRDWIFRSDLGVSMAIPPRLIARSRLRRNFISDLFIYRFYEQLTFITDESGLVEETGFDADHVFNENFIFRFVNYKRWQVLKKNFTTNHGPTLIHRLTENDALNYGFTGQTTITDGIWYLSNYRLSVNYRRNMYKQWIYFDVIPGIDFPKIRSFRRTPFMIFQLELLFRGT